jgi:hypothetical protein
MFVVGREFEMILFLMNRRFFTACREDLQLHSLRIEVLHFRRG